jgi:hypothetical protein
MSHAVRAWLARSALARPIDRERRVVHSPSRLRERFEAGRNSSSGAREIYVKELRSIIDMHLPTVRDPDRKPRPKHDEYLHDRLPVARPGSPPWDDALADA